MSEAQNQETTATATPEVEVEVVPNVQEVVTPTTKAVVMGGRSFAELEADVHQAWREAHSGGWVAEVYEKHAIVFRDGTFWKVPYERDADSVTLSSNAAWTEMKPNRGFTEKFVKNFADQLTTVKQIDDETVGAYAILWGDEKHRDLHKQWFTKSTQELTSIFEQMGAVPYLFQHGADGVVKSTVIGSVSEMSEDEIGLWFEAKVKQHETYKKLVKPLLDEEKLFPSSGVLPAAMRVKKSGEITRWPIMEITATNIPAEHRMLNMPIAEINKMYKSAGLPNFADEEDAAGGASEKEALELKLRQQELELRLLEIS